MAGDISDLKEFEDSSETFDSKEKKLIELDKVKEDKEEELTKQKQLKAEMEQGIMILGDKVGIDQTEGTTMREKLRLCNGKIQELE